MTSLRVGLVLVGIAALDIGCGPATPPEPPQLVVASARTTASAAPTPAGPPVLPPLAADKRSPCEIAAEKRSAAATAAEERRYQKALSLVTRADVLCPSTAPVSWETRLAALGELERDDEMRALAQEITAASGAGAGAVAAAKTALARPKPTAVTGEAALSAAIAAGAKKDPNARLLADRALARLAQEEGARPAVWLDEDAHAVMAFSRDGTTVVRDVGDIAVVSRADLRPIRFFEHKLPPQPPSADSWRNTRVSTAVRAAAVSSDGADVVTVHEDGGTFLWSVTTGKRRFRLVWAVETPKIAAFSLDNKRVVVAGEKTHANASCRVWNAETGDSVDSFSTDDGGEATAVAIAPDNKLVAVGTEQGTLELWSIEPAKRIATLAHKNSFMDTVEHVAFSPKGDKVAASFGGGMVSVWDTKPVKVAPGAKPAPAKPAAPKPAGDPDDPDVKPALAADAKQPLWESAELDRGREYSPITFSEDGARLTATGRAGFKDVLMAWDSASGKALQSLPSPAKLKLFSAHGKKGVADDGAFLSVVDVASGGVDASVPRFSFNARSVRFGPPRQITVAGDGDAGLLVITPQTARALKLPDRWGQWATSADGQILAWSGYDDVRTFNLTTFGPGPAYPPLRQSRAMLSFDGLSNVLRSTSDAGDDILGYQAAPGQGTWRETFRLDGVQATYLYVSSHGHYAAGVEDKRVFVIDLHDGRSADVAFPGDGRPDSVALSPDGSTLFVIRDRQLYRFATATTQRLSPAFALSCYGRELSPSWDGKAITMSCFDGVLTLRFPEDKAVAPEVLKWEEKTRRYDDLALSPHGDLVVGIERDGEIALHTAAGALRARIHPLAGGEGAVIQSADGRVSLQGKEPKDVDRFAMCRIGTRALPLWICADSVLDDTLAAEVFAPASP